MGEDKTKTVRLRISGEVQGVWFRAWTVQKARALNLHGWVRNRKGGDVEVLAQGEEGAIGHLILLCRDGPPAARVDHVEVEAAKGVTLHTFVQKPTV